MEVTLTFGYGDMFVLGMFVGTVIRFVVWLIKELKDY